MFNIVFTKSTGLQKMVVLSCSIKLSLAFINAVPRLVLQLNDVTFKQILI